MTNNDLFTGKLTRLVAADPDKTNGLWSRDSELLQLLDSDPPMPRTTKHIKEQMQKEAEKNRPGIFAFHIQSLNEARLIGEAGLWDAHTPHRNGWLAVAIYERELWGKGYGTDAIDLILGYAFCELNLHRVSLNAFGFNTRAIRAYEKLGFFHEGKLRGAMRRYGQRTDFVFMGILRAEWDGRLAGSG